MKIDQLLEDKKTFSFEFFPPKTEVGEANLFKTIAELKQLNPDFVSITYGAGGSTKGKTCEWAKKIKKDFAIEPLVHLTCVDTNKEEISEIVNSLKQDDIYNIMALRGDLPKSTVEARGHEPLRSDFKYASDLITYLNDQHSEVICGGAAYPEKHPEAKDIETDLQNLKTKVAAGAKFLVTQLFFENSYYYELVSKARDLDINVPIIPGIMPITSTSQIAKFITMAGCEIPQELKHQINSSKDDAEVSKIGIPFALKQCRDLLANGAPGIHFYTLNKSDATRTILEQLRLSPLGKS